MLVATGGLCFARHRGRKVGFMLARLTNAFALLLCAGVAWAWIVPAHFTWFLPYISPGLGLIMLGLDRPAAALRSFEAALAVRPYLPGARTHIVELRRRLDGDPI